jgi:hypothetical protein
VVGEARRALMTSLLCRGRNAVAEFSFSYSEYSTFHFTSVCKPCIYHSLNKDYFIEVDEILRLNISVNVLRGKNYLSGQDTNRNQIAIN